MKDFRITPRWQRIYRTCFYKWLCKRFLKNCHTILDIGSGDGDAYDTFTKFGKKIRGIDIDKRAIRDNIILKDYKNIKEHYDCFFSSQFIEHVNQFEYMGIAKKYCDKIIITITPKPTTKFWNNPYHIRPYTTKALRKLYMAYGFKTIYSRNLCPTRSLIGVGRKEK